MTGPLALGAGLIAAAYAVGNQRPTFTNKRGGHPTERPTMPSTIMIDPPRSTIYRNEAASINETIGNMFHGISAPSGDFLRTMIRIEQHIDRTRVAEIDTHPGVILVRSFA